jgi:hypothetical protein
VNRTAFLEEIETKTVAMDSRNAVDFRLFLSRGNAAQFKATPVCDIKLGLADVYTDITHDWLLELKQLSPAL